MCRGDLNYRLDLGREECLEMIYDHSWGKLQQHDQLLKAGLDGHMRRNVLGKIEFQQICVEWMKAICMTGMTRRFLS